MGGGAGVCVRERRSPLGQATSTRAATRLGPLPGCSIALPLVGDAPMRPLALLLELGLLQGAVAALIFVFWTHAIKQELGPFLAWNSGADPDHADSSDRDQAHCLRLVHASVACFEPRGHVQSISVHAC